MESISAKLGGRTTLRNPEHFCGPDGAARFLPLASIAFSRPGKAFHANEEFVSALCGVNSEVLDHLWCAYGGALLKMKLEHIHLMWFMSYAKLYIPWIVIARFWGVGRTVFRERVELVAKTLFTVMDEVCHHFYRNSSSVKHFKLTHMY